MGDLSYRAELSNISSLLREISEKVTRTDQDMGTLLGAPGREGKIPKMERAIEDLQSFRDQVGGSMKTTMTVWGGMSAALGVCGHYLIDALRRK